jgi:nitrous oxide reductase accessory protein NosL
VTRALAIAGVLALAACADKANAGPAEVKWDRDACTGCSMVISEHGFAAQVRGGPRSDVFKFDDIGCAVKWLAKQPWANEPATKVWVARQADGTWLDARTARYEAGKTSPMGFNFGAVDPGTTGLSFDEMKARVLAPR